MNKIPCEVIKDLFPSYVDGLTSDVTNGEIDRHVKDCSLCRAVLESMKQTEQEEHVMNEAEKKEINFLRKTRKRSIRMVLAGIAAVLALVLAVLGIRVFVTGSETGTHSIAANVRVEGRHVTVDGMSVDSACGISRVSVTEKDGVVDIRTHSVLTGLYSGDFHSEYDASETVKRVIVNGRVIWDDGVRIPALASDVFSTAHDYVGDMSANSATAAALGMPDYLGGYTNELKTSEKPYRWRILIDQDYTARQQAVRERDMEAFAHILIGVIGNLDEVEFVYRVDGEELTRTVTVDDSVMFFGADIKQCGKSPRVLAELIDREGIEDYLFHRSDVFEQQSELSFRVINETDGDIYAVSVSVYKDGSLCSTQSAQNADNSPIPQRGSLFFSVLPEDFGGTWEDGAELFLEFTVYMDPETGTDINQRVRVAPAAGVLSNIIIDGNAADGYRINVS